MNKPGSVNSMRFDRSRQRIPARAVAVAVAIAGFWLVWERVPRDLGFWLLVIVVTVLTWMASYSWRQSLTALIRFLHRLEQL